MILELEDEADGFLSQLQKIGIISETFHGKYFRLWVLYRLAKLHNIWIHVNGNR